MADALTVIGFAGVCTGVALFCWPAALIVGGTLLLGLGLFGAARERAKP